ncbi:MAG TPA: metalloregulator ArsR/SmtB family transcription factor [Syntrophomonadaceae bacterium]|nr:metalloregulator ArsR/SmtB family transcription factor [Syntrophomonadaceae bacterium]
MDTFENIFKALGEPTRLKIVKLLASRELCVCELEAIMQISQPRISQHLKILKQVGLVTERREGQKRMCRFNRNIYEDFMNSFDSFMCAPLNEIPGYEKEADRLESIYPLCKKV